MKCSEIQEWLGDAIDREMPASVMAEFLAHVRACLQCRNEYELELLGRNIVRNTVRPVALPEHVHRTLLNALEQDYRRPRSGGGWLERLLSGRILAPVLTASLAIVILLILLNIPTTQNADQFAHTASNDIINQSLKNFDLVRSGLLKPSMVACYPDVIVAYFHRQDVNFAVSVLSDDSCDWYGAMSNKYGGVKLAHVVYKRGDDLLYVYEVDKEQALKGPVLTLPAAARTALNETGWYTDPQHKNCNVVVWIVDKTLCAAVSTMKKDRMLALLTTK